ncbi:membrane selenoprotein, partial [Haematococcus lacustris]
MCRSKGIHGLACLTLVGWLFSILFTYSGFVLMISAVFWSASLGSKIKAAMDLLTNASVLEHLMRGPHHRGIKLLP